MSQQKGPEEAYPQGKSLVTHISGTRRSVSSRPKYSSKTRPISLPTSPRVPTTPDWISAAKVPATPAWISARVPAWISGGISARVSTTSRVCSSSLHRLTRSTTTTNDSHHCSAACSR